MEDRNVSYKIRYIAEEISKQSIEGEALFLLTSYNKMKKERGELKKKMWSKKEPEAEGLEISQPIHITKNENACSEENIKIWPNNHLIKRSWMWLTDLVSHLSRSQEQRLDYVSKYIAGLN